MRESFIGELKGALPGVSLIPKHLDKLTDSVVESMKDQLADE